jgi:hypothetical protein
MDVVISDWEKQEINKINDTIQQWKIKICI